jgi:hypothetical protein
MATGFTVLSRLGTTSSDGHLFAGLLLLGTGMGLSGSPATTAIVASLPPEKQGVASSINDLSRELGGAIGIAVLGSLLNSVYRSDISQHTAALPPTLAAKAQSSLGAAQTIAHRLGSHQLVDQANSAFAHGVNLALLAGAGVLIVSAAFVAVRAPGQIESEATTDTTNDDALPTTRLKLRIQR